MKKKKITYTQIRPEWVERVNQKNALRVFGYLVALSRKQKSNIEWREKRKQVVPKCDLFWRSIRLNNMELGEYLMSGGIKKSSVRSAALRAITSLQEAGLIALYSSPHLINKHQERLIEVLWDGDLGVFVEPYNKEAAECFTGSTVILVKQNASVDLPILVKQNTVDLPILVKQNTNSSEAKNDSSEALVKQKGRLVKQNASLAFSIHGSTEPQNPDFQSHKNILITDNSTTEETVPAPLVATQAIPENINPTSMPTEKTKGPAPLLSFYETTGVKEDEQLLRLHAIFIKEVKEKYGFDPAPFFEADMYRKIVASELHPDVPLEFAPLDMFAVPNFGYELRIFEGDYITSSRWPSPVEAFYALMRNYPRGFSWKYDAGVPWGSPPKPFVMYGSSDEYKKVLKAYKNPFKKDTGFTTMDLVVDFYKSFPLSESKNISMHWINPEFSRRMQWLCGNTGLYFGAIDELYKEFKALVKNPSSLLGAYYAKNVAAHDGVFSEDMMSWFKSFALGRQLENRGIYIMRNTDDHWILKSPGSIIDERTELGGNVVYHQDSNGKRQEVYMTPYQFAVWEDTLYINRQALDKVDDKSV